MKKMLDGMLGIQLNSTKRKLGGIMKNKLLLGMIICLILTSCQLGVSSNKDNALEKKADTAIEESRGSSGYETKSYPLIVPMPYPVPFVPGAVQMLPTPLGHIEIPKKIASNPDAVRNYLDNIIRSDFRSAKKALDRYNKYFNELNNKFLKNPPRNDEELMKWYLDFIIWEKEHGSFFDEINKPIYRLLQAQSKMIKDLRTRVYKHHKKVFGSMAGYSKKNDPFYNALTTTLNIAAKLNTFFNLIPTMTNPSIMLGKVMFSKLKNNNNLKLGNITYSGNVYTAIRVTDGKGQALPNSLVYVIHNGKKYYCIADKYGRFEFKGLKSEMEITFNIIPMPNFEQYNGVSWNEFWEKHVMNFIFNDMTGFYETKTQTMLVGHKNINDITTQVPSRLVAQIMSTCLETSQNTIEKGFIMGTVCSQTHPQEKGQGDCTVKLLDMHGRDTGIKPFYYGKMTEVKDDELVKTIADLLKQAFGLNPESYPIPHKTWKKTTPDGGYCFVNVPEGDYYIEVTHTINPSRYKFTKIKVKARKGYFTIASSPYSSTLISSPAPLSPILAGDFDGDRKSDMVRVCNDGFETWMSQAGHKFKYYKEKPKNFNKSSWVAADTNRNGVDEIINGLDKWGFSSHNGFSRMNGRSNRIDKYNLKLNSSEKLKKTSYGDFNGDGRDDKLHITNKRLVLHPSFEGGYEKSTPISPWDDDQFLVGDFNGDKIKDVILMTMSKPKGRQWFLKVDLLLGQRNGQFKETKLDLSKLTHWLARNYFCGTYGEWHVGDFDGNGFDDLIHFSEKRGNFTYTWLMGTSEPLKPKILLNRDKPINDNKVKGTWLTGDYNGDGKTDLVKMIVGGKAETWFSNGTSHYTKQSFLPWGGYNLGRKWVSGVDLNGDSVTDIVHDVNNVYGHTWVSKNNGTFHVGTYRNQ